MSRFLKKSAIAMAAVQLGSWGAVVAWAQNIPAGLPNSPPVQENSLQLPPTDPIVIDPTQNPDETLLPAVPPRLITEPDQVVVVREKFAGWQEAADAASGKPISDVLRSNWVMISANGLLSGRVVPSAEANDIADIPVYLLSRGRDVMSARTNANGEFSFNNVDAGTYSLVGMGANAFFAFSFNAIEYRDSVAERMPQMISVMAVENKTTINLDWIRYFASKTIFRVYGRFESKQGTDDPAALLGQEGITLLAPDAIPATSILAHGVSLTADNRLLGRVHQVDALTGRPIDIRNTRILLLQNNDIVGATSADYFGTFTFHDVAPGDYALVAAGNDGMGCVGVRVVSADDTAIAHRPAVDFTMITSESVGWLNHQATELAYQRIIGRPNPFGTPECEQCGFDGCFGMGSKKKGPFRKLFQGVNDFFDEVFYGESNWGQGSIGDGKYQPRGF